MSEHLTFNLTPDELEIFLEDVNDCLQVMETGILHLEQKHDPETLNSVFRAAHTLKAIAGTVGHRQMAELTHTLETLFHAMRKTKLSATQAVANELLEVVDVLKVLRDEIVNQQPSGIDVEPLLARLRALQKDDEVQEQVPPTSTPALGQMTPEQEAQLKEMHTAGQIMLEIEIVAAAETFAPAARLYQAAIALMEAGQIITQQPALDGLSEEDKRLWLILATESEPADIETILNDIADLAECHVQPYTPESNCQPESSPPTPQSLPADGKNKGGAPTDDLIPQPDSDNSPDIVVQNKTEGATSSKSGGPSLNKSEGTVRISTERLDKLMNLVGELVTNRTRLLQIEDMLRIQYGKDSSVAALSELVPHFSQVVDQLQEEVMRARMLPIASLFNKLPRLVRDLAHATGKQVDLVIEGEATELDRAVIEAIGDPLLHLLRNAVDHGIETPQVRQAVDKPTTGTINLAAASVESQIVITLTDDGHGIDPDQIRQAVIQNEHLAADEIKQLSDDEIVELIFQPNLSTATEVTEMSGRGVGLDIVKTNIERLGGAVVVTSEVGQGTTFQLTLPLTLALVQTMLVTVQNTLYAIPVTGINAAMYLAEAARNTIKGKPALDWQEATVPLLNLRDYFAKPHMATGSSNLESKNGVKPSVVLVSWGKHRVGLVVDSIIGQQEIVVKSLSPLIGHTPGLSGATILGDGSIALIVDIPSLINAALRTLRQRER